MSHIGRTHALSKLRPGSKWVMEDDNFTISWRSDVIPPTEEEIEMTIIELRNEYPLKELRRVRDSILEETDKYMSIIDYPISAEKKEIRIYRQALRDLPQSLVNTTIDSENLEQYFPVKPI